MVWGLISWSFSLLWTQSKGRRGRISQGMTVGRRIKTRAVFFNVKMSFFEWRQIGTGWVIVFNNVNSVDQFPQYRFISKCSVNQALRACKDDPVFVSIVINRFFHKGWELHRRGFCRYLLNLKFMSIGLILKSLLLILSYSMTGKFGYSI